MFAHSNVRETHRSTHCALNSIKGRSTLIERGKTERMNQSRQWPRRDSFLRRVEDEIVCIEIFFFSDEDDDDVTLLELTGIRMTQCMDAITNAGDDCGEKEKTDDDHADPKGNFVMQIVVGKRIGR